MTRYKNTSDKTGMPPGTVVYVGDNPPQATKMSVHIYDKHHYHNIIGFDFDAIHEALAANKHVWVDISGLADITNISKLCAELEIHPLISEDIVNTHQRPKLESFDHYTYLVFRLIGPPAERLAYNSEQFSMLSNKNLLVTFRESDAYDLSSLYQRLSGELSMVRQHGSDYLTYLIMDNIIDHYFNFVEISSSMLISMENALIEGHETISLKSIYVIKRHSLTLRKTVGPLCDIIDTLLTDPSHLINSAYRLYYRDLRDHTLRLLESIEMNYDMTASILDIYLSTVNNSINKTMKILTKFASTFIPLTFVAGVYGMNFEYMPELQYRYGYPAVLGVMGLMVVGMVVYFKRKKLD